MKPLEPSVKSCCGEPDGERALSMSREQGGAWGRDGNLSTGEDGGQSTYGNVSSWTTLTS